MELTVEGVADLAGVSTHQVNVALRSGVLAALRTIGNTVIIDDIAAQAWNRSRGRGRRWSETTREAALDLASTGTTNHLAGPSLSRLRRVLRTLGAHDFAYYAGGLGGGWARYQLLEEPPELDYLHHPSQPSAIDLGVVPGGLTIARTDDLARFERENLVTLDASGSLGVIERLPDTRLARRLLDAYLLGSSRESAAAARLLEEAAHDL